MTLKNLVSALKSIESRWNDLGNDLKFPKFVLEDIERQNQTSRERLTAVLKHYLQLHPFASWRRIIRALERLEEPVIVKQIRKYAEHILGKKIDIKHGDIVGYLSISWIQLAGLSFYLAQVAVSCNTTQVFLQVCSVPQWV